ncbi:ligand-binding sensor domain-containing protein [Flexithrix dorotheae]|uniref:ligand-binding sensor domain-containing protein n=1 Tax=Flexithrix dorotheae TaxID=70993 RepID=UPI0004765D3E|nr:triple tyrosine motif-containing protein [Flexithrix dorotheae]
MKFTLHFLIFIASALPTIAQTHFGLPLIKYYSTDEYGAGMNNLHIAQDERGIIYVANNFGLLEYDGTSWRLLQTGETGVLRHLSINADHEIAIAGSGKFGYFKTDEYGNWKYQPTSTKIDKKFDEVWKAFHIGQSKFFCGSYNIVELQNDSITVFPFENKMDNFFLINNQIYVYQPEKGISIFKNGKLTSVCSDPAILGLYVSDMIRMKGDQILVATNVNGIYILSAKTLRPWNPPYQKLFSKYIINTIIRLRNGDLAIGTQTNGLMIFSWNGFLKSHLSRNTGLDQLTINSLFEDAQNNLWAGHNNGISCLELGLPFSFINENVGLPGSGHTGFQEGNSLYLGTNNGLFKWNIDKPLSEDNHPVKLLEGQIYGLSKLNHKILIGQYRNSYYLDNDKPVKINETGTWKFSKLNHTSQYVINGTYDGFELNEMNNNEVRFLGKIKGFIQSCQNFEQDDLGNLWLAHGYKGIYRIKLTQDLKTANEVKEYSIDHGLPSDHSIIVNKIRGELCFSTPDGIYRYNSKSDSFEKHPFYQQFFKPNFRIFHLAEDANENIYYVGIGEVGVLRKEASNNYTKFTTRFSKILNMLNNSPHFVTVLPNDKVLFGAKNGFIIYDPLAKVDDQENFKVLIRNFSLSKDPDSVIYFGNTFDDNQIPKPELLHHQNSLKFSYSATYIDPQQMTQYQYKLEGFDDSWSKWEFRHEKEYTNLDYGAYEFKVRAKIFTGKVSEEESYKFVILPPWYQTNLAYFSYLFLGCILLLASLYFISRKFKKEKSKILNEQKNVLTKKDQELDLIKTKSEKAIEELKTGKLRDRIRHKNKELATATMHIIDKNDFLSDLKQDLTSLTKKNSRSVPIGELEKLMASIEKNMSRDDDWKHFEVYFDQVHGDFSKRLTEKFPKLSPQDRRLCAYLRMNMTTKEIASLLNITIRGVEISRYRLRKKLNLTREINLAEFILNF